MNELSNKQEDFVLELWREDLANDVWLDKLKGGKRDGN